jgi:hypothetical protein
MSRAPLDLGCSLHPIVDIEFPKNLVQMVFYRKSADAQNAAYLGISFPFSHPIHDFRFPIA